MTQCTKFLFAVVACWLLLANSATADLTWDTSTGDTTNTDGAGTWQVGLGNWFDNTGAAQDQVWADGEDAIFGGTAGTAGTVTLGGNILANTVRFNAPSAGTYTLELGANNLTTNNTFGAITVKDNTTATISGSGGGQWVINNTSSSTYTADLTGTLNVSAKVTGTGRIYTGGAGNLNLTNDANDFTGILGKQNGGSLTITSIADSGNASAAGAGTEVQVGYNATLNYTGAGDSTNRTLRIFGNNSTVANNGTGALVFTGTFNNQTDDGQVNGRTFTLRGTNTSTDNEIQGNITDSTKSGATSVLSVAKSDAGTWKLSGNNTYTGTTTINAGTLIVASDNALGSTVGSTTVANGAKLWLDGSAGDLTIAEDITLNGGGSGNINNRSGNNTITGAVTLANGVDLRRAGGTLTFEGGINSVANQGISFNLPTIVNTTAIDLNDGTLTITSNGNNIANASEINVAGNDWGLLRINFQGYLKLGVANALASDADVEFGWHVQGSSSGTLDLNGFDQTVGSIGVTPFYPDREGDQNITGGGTLTVNQTVAGTKEYQGRITDGATATSLVKDGIGTTVLNNLSGTNSNYTGTTTINGGTLALESTTENNNISGSSEIIVGSGATLDVTGITTAGGFDVVSGQTISGNGNVVGDTKVSGIVAPGASIGTLSFENNLDLDGTLQVELDGAGSGLVDLLAVSGTLDITGATVDFSVIGDALDDDTYIFATHAGLTGVFANILNTPDGYMVKYNFVGAGNNNIVLTSVPEPGSLQLAFLAFTGLMCRRKRNR